MRIFIKGPQIYFICKFFTFSATNYTSAGFSDAGRSLAIPLQTNLLTKVKPLMEAEFLHIISLHQGIIHKVCRLYRDSPEDREDLFQEIVYQLWRAFPAFEGRAKVSSWMYRIALNTALASFRKHTPDITYPVALPEQVLDLPEGSIQQEQLLAALKQLNDSEKAIIALYLDDMTYQEIAAIIGIDENYVGVKLNRIKTKLKNMLNSG
jgi:RNA polymerase sigma factor (sigma-70 family)